MKKPTFSLEEIQQAIDDHNGFCIKCRYEQEGVEPDAREYECDECGENAVYGAEELVVMGLVR